MDKTKSADLSGDEAVEETMFKCWSDSAADAERDEAIGLILHHLNMTIVRTNRTKHGNIELVLREDK